MTFQEKNMQLGVRGLLLQSYSGRTNQEDHISKPAPDK
jgi:hypothetical protein